ncbi:hypothetical protein BX600DRAFT_471242 [Xylariales sp. PMI_506]|nr:hypothetical protein BX600DRAFT_471242 [Xylariales sp. PMI_506]
MQIWSVASEDNDLASEYFTLVSCPDSSEQDWDVVIDGVISLGIAASDLIDTVLSSGLTTAELRETDEATRQQYFDTWWMFFIEMEESGISAADTARLETIQENFNTIVSQLDSDTTTVFTNAANNFLLCDPEADLIWTQDVSVIDPNGVMNAANRAVVSLGVWYLKGYPDDHGVPKMFWADPEKLDPCRFTAAHSGNGEVNMLLFCPEFFNTPAELYDTTSDTTNVDSRTTQSSVFLHELCHWLFGWDDEKINWSNSPLANSVNGATAYGFALAHYLARSRGTVASGEYQCDVNPDNYRVFADMAYAPDTAWTMPS